MLILTKDNKNKVVELDKIDWAWIGVDKAQTQGCIDQGNVWFQNSFGLCKGKVQWEWIGKNTEASSILLHSFTLSSSLREKKKPGSV